MWARFGLAIAHRQLRANGGAALTRWVALRAPAVAHSGVILRRAFAQSRHRALAAAATKVKTKKTASKPKKKPAAKPKAKKAAAKKPKKTAVKKKVLTKEEERSLHIKELKKVARLRDEPATLPSNSAYVVYLSTTMRAMKRAGTGMTIEESRRMFSKATADFKNLSASELEKYKSTAAANRLENEAAKKAWILKHSPQEIVEINNARRQLNALNVYKHKVPMIIDPRAPKRPRNGFFLYAKARTEPGQLPDFKQLAEEWRSLSDSERQPFLDNAAVDMVRYEQEVRAVYDREVTRRAARRPSYKA